MATIKTILKLTPIHAVVKISGTSATETIHLGSDLLWNNNSINGNQQEVAGTPVVNIMGMYWNVPSATLFATVVRNSITIWNLQGQFNFDFRGWADSQQNTSDIVVTLPATESEVVIELLKVSGYGNTSHLNSLV